MVVGGDGGHVEGGDLRLRVVAHRQLGHEGVLLPGAVAHRPVAVEHHALLDPFLTVT